MATWLRRPVRSEWSGAVLVCGKCSRKIGGGFGKKGKTPLVKALHKALGLKKGRRAVLGVVETKCLGLCPKDAVTVIDTARPGEWQVVRTGAAINEVITGLALSCHPREGGDSATLSPEEAGSPLSRG